MLIIITYYLTIDTFRLVCILALHSKCDAYSEEIGSKLMGNTDATESITCISEFYFMLRT